MTEFFPSCFPVNVKKGFNDMKKRTWICYYINSRGDERQKVFDDMEKGLAFTQLLDKRIERGTCGGYSFMEL